MYQEVHTISLLIKPFLILKRENKELTKEIIKIHKENNRRYGAPKIHKQLEKKGYQVSLKRVQRLMRKAGIKSIIVKRFVLHPVKQSYPQSVTDKLKWTVGGADVFLDH